VSIFILPSDQLGGFIPRKQQHRKTTEKQQQNFWSRGDCKAPKSKKQSTSIMDLNARVQAIALEQDAEMTTPRGDVGGSDSEVGSESDGDEDTATLTQPAQATLTQPPNFTQPPVNFTPTDPTAQQPGATQTYHQMLAFILNPTDRRGYSDQLNQVDGKIARGLRKLNDTKAKIDILNAAWANLNASKTPSQVTMEFFHAATAGPHELSEFTTRFIHHTANEDTIMKFAADFQELAELTKILMEKGMVVMRLAHQKRMIVQNITGYVEAQRSTLYTGLDALQQSVSANGLFQNTQ
jgi:hypothetical protein